MIEEARLEDRGEGLVVASQGWFVLNARDARWFDTPGWRHSLPLTGTDEYEAETFFPMLGMALRVLEPGKPMSAYHWETEAEDFLVLAGTPLVIVKGQERMLRQWDVVHCPPGANHVFVGAGDGLGRGGTTPPTRSPRTTAPRRRRRHRTVRSRTATSRRAESRATRRAG
jgi:cupin domain